MANYPQQTNKNMINSPYNKGNRQGAPQQRQGMGNTPPWSSASGGRALFPPVQYGPSSYGAPPYGAPQQKAPKAPATPQYTPKQIKKLEKQKRREKDHFFVMRKFVSFLIFLFSLVLVVAIALPIVSYFVALPESITSVVNPNIAILTIADTTPLDEREADYIDASVHISLGDLVLGAVGNVTKSFTELGFLKDEEGNSTTPFYDETLAGLQAIEDPNDTMASTAALIFRFAPLGIILVLIVALITMVKSFVGIFGKRIFKRFGLSAIIMLVFVLVTLVGGLAALGLRMGNPQMVDDNFVSVMDFNNLLPFLTGFINNPPLTAVDLTISAAPVVLQAGIGAIVLAGASVLILFLSFFARKKVPYSIFDK